MSFFSTDSPDSAEKQTEPEAASRPAQPPSFKAEAAVLALIVVYGMVYIIGKAHNNGTAKRLAENWSELMQSSFSHVGDPHGKNPIEESAYEYVPFSTCSSSCYTRALLLLLAF